ncbi:MAG: GntR family transcriptional regulator [Pusillimonas sp.]
MNLDDYVAGFPQQSPTAAESISRLLRQAILDGALEGGSVLRQGEIAKRFGVSRIPVREALLKLEGEGLVETQPRQGVVVTMLSADDFVEILEMRYALESLALDLAAPRFKDEDLDDALAIVIEAEKSMPTPADQDPRKEFESRWGNLNWVFHRRLYTVANRPRLLTSIENLHQLFARHLRVRIDDTGTAASASSGERHTLLEANRREWTDVLEEHRQIALACARHDAEAAKEILKRHIYNHGGELVRKLKETTV